MSESFQVEKDSKIIKIVDSKQPKKGHLYFEKLKGLISNLLINNNNEYSWSISTKNCTIIAIKGRDNEIKTLLKNSKKKFLNKYGTIYNLSMYKKNKTDVIVTL